MSELDPSFQNSSPTKTPKNSLDEEIDEDEESILDDQSIDDVGTIEENCDDNDDPFDWELEVPIDVSIDSDSSQDDSDVSEFEIQESKVGLTYPHRIFSPWGMGNNGEGKFFPMGNGEKWGLLFLMVK